MDGFQNPKKYTLISHSPDETRKLALSLAQYSRKGDVYAIYGELASGKTTFIQGFCQFFGVRIPVTSPSFTLINEYRGNEQIYHMDFYRLKEPEDALKLGYEEYISGDGIVLVEWADRIQTLIPMSAYRIWFEFHDKEINYRKVTINSPIPLSFL
jgi:tRNA threonylcarbamoyladenosine biosynthesis protein TsaE